jgi:outer membrane lipoprotein-sorting protein
MTTSRPSPLPRPRRSRALAFVSVLALAACGNSEAPGGAASTGSAPQAASVAASASAAPIGSPSASASVEAAPSVPAASASATASASAAPAASAAPHALIADAGAPHDAGAKHPATDKDAGADAGQQAAAGDAGPAAAASPAAAIAQQIDAIFAQKKTFTAKFKQDFAQKVSGVSKKSSGVLFIERPNKISFRYDPPSKNRIVSDGTTLKVYIAEDSQMFESPVQNTQYSDAFGFLMGKGIASSFNFVMNDKTSYTNGPVITGKPTAPGPSYDSITFFANKALLDKQDPGALEKILIVDAQGNKNRFEFDSAAQPDKIDPSEFQFTPPPGTDIKR